MIGWVTLKKSFLCFVELAVCHADVQMYASDLLPHIAYSVECYRCEIDYHKLIYLNRLVRRLIDTPPIGQFL